MYNPYVRNHTVDITDIDFGHFLGNFKSKMLVDFQKLGIDYQWNVKRECSPFVFSPAMKYAIKIRPRNESQVHSYQSNQEYRFKAVEYPEDFTDPLNEAKDDDNQSYQQFIDNCRVAYNVVRKRDRLFFTLMRLMIPSQMPELIRETDIEYMKKMLHLEIERDEEIEALVIQSLNESCADRRRILDNVVHAWKHSKG
ncbi:phosphatidylinositol-4,5-bisphosphate 3-kinase catalytic subunit gamma [Reticulomyxa filosa]|uniref:Phosphatidylinositol-4,5-bisphosphate 3-kinase catalytic subunit gamma n=1 Tax=Reticulomyxa filosa TaxID=46433 RepID=X6MJD3_RETFI|nr:phosphatidylinositol-4,5-bisphosphate 3-kinase catalytic subunit gamma [Reticulomyxa filosa]|eukprot:ETO13949.1 phosphatidylinositol-4,5-bisphosphate 3-kinase catalytic subunit gamma [Reticulomyxa filosa]